MQLKTNNDVDVYRGRFAPSPSGPLHFGSLVAALGSFLQAKSQKGLWFVRIEDIDKTREQDGAIDIILTSLQKFGLQWDHYHNDQFSNDIVYDGCLIQSSRVERYERVLSQLIDNQAVYACQCTRKKIRQLGQQYTGVCKNKTLPFDAGVIRLHAPITNTSFSDNHFGMVNIPKEITKEDYIIKRRDGLFSYQLVVVIDDIDQQITEVVRGADIMELTTRQMALFKLFDTPSPNYLHLPLAVNQTGLKLSKQNHAKAINIDDPKPELMAALKFLGLPINKEPDLTSGSINDIITWSIKQWTLSNIPKQTEMPI